MHIAKGHTFAFGALTCTRGGSFKNCAWVTLVNWLISAERITSDIKANSLVALRITSEIQLTVNERAEGFACTQAITKTIVDIVYCASCVCAEGSVKALIRVVSRCDRAIMSRWRCSCVRLAISLSCIALTRRRVRADDTSTNIRRNYGEHKAKTKTRKTFKLANSYSECRAESKRLSKQAKIRTGACSVSITFAE